ncbi:MAG: TDT family transporter [Lachnospirales bacterium]
MEKSIFQRTENLPIPVVATALSVCTLGNVYGGLGFPFLKMLAMVFGVVILFFYLVKIAMYFGKCKTEYTTNTVFASLYGAITMVIMITSSYFMTWIPALKYVIIAAVVVHACHILVFLYLNLIKNFQLKFFVPSWFVTLNGIMVSTVVAMPVLPEAMAKAVLYWGIAAYTIAIPFMIYRLAKVEMPRPAYHTQAILLAPCSLIVASYINATGLGYVSGHMGFVSVYYTCVVLSFLFILVKIPKFFSFPFAPGFAGLTFPMAIGVVASSKMSGYLSGAGYEQMGHYIKQLEGVQIVITTIIIGFVVYNFAHMFFKKPEE